MVNYEKTLSYLLHKTSSHQVKSYQDYFLKFPYKINPLKKDNLPV